jgi:hypothetical protein
MVRAGRTLLLTFAAVAMMASSTPSGQFKWAAYYPAGQGPYQLVTAPLTQSTNMDIAAADYITNQISILLGNGDGTFQKPIKFAVPAPVAVAVGDFNDDGILDLAVAEYGGTGESALGIFLGDGTGRFHLSATYQSGVETTSVALADFNGDGHLDVAVVNNAGNVKVFFGTGKGTLNPPTTYKLTGTNPYGIAAGDLNRDGHPDLAVAEALAGSVAVLMNDGTGKFLKPATYNAGGGEAVDVKIADLRHDGREDLVVANLSAGTVVLLNNGNGSFGKPTIYVPMCHNCQGPEACVVADFNLDGHLDVACATNIVTSYFFYGDGTGKFGPAIPIHDTIQNRGGFSIAAGDFNNDKAPDLAIPIEMYGKVAIMINTQ